MARLALKVTKHVFITLLVSVLFLLSLFLGTLPASLLAIVDLFSTFHRLKRPYSRGGLDGGRRRLSYQCKPTQVED